MTAEEESEGFLSRWSRRKRAAEAGLAVTDAPAQPAAGADPAPPALPAEDAPPVVVAEEPPFDPASLPPIEELTSASDFTAFLRHNVPAALKRAALRRAWTLDPAIRDFVGLADYDWDFNAPDGITGFSLELGGDVKRLLAQAVGIERDEEAAAIAQAKRDMPDEPPLPLEGSDEAPPSEAPAAPPEAEPVMAEAVPADEAPEAGARRSRHGSALPS